MKQIYLYILFAILSSTHVSGSSRFSAPGGACLADTTDTIVRSKALGEVKILGSNVVNYADRDVILITKNMRKGARNTAQLIGNIQGFDCDIINNELKYYGSGKILLTVDSIPKMADYIKELHHMRFEKVEVIHSPSGKWAEYDVVVNFHTRPDYEGYEGNLHDNGRFLPNDGNGEGKNLSSNTAGGQFTWTKNKWNVVASYDFDFNQGKYNDATSTTLYKDIGIKDITVSPSVENECSRRHRVYTAVDYQISKDHRVSLTYSLTGNNSDNSLSSGKTRLWTATGLNHMLMDSKTDDRESWRHTIGVYYGGNVKGWGLFYDFNYINNLNKTDYSYTQNHDFAIVNRFSDRMNYVWSNIGFNKRFDRYYLTASHSFVYKGYDRDNRLTNVLLSRNEYYRNQMTLWMSYRFAKGTELTFGSKMSHVHVENLTGRMFDNNIAFSSTLFHRFGKKTWLRVNYWYDIENPELDHVTDNGYFTDSLHYHEGNPSLETSIIRRGRVWLNCFGFLGLQVGFDYAPNQFARIIYPYHTSLGNDVTGVYVADRFENTRYKDWWCAVNLQKQFGDFSIRAYVKYQNMRARYGGDNTNNDGFGGNATMRYYHAPLSLTTEVGYQYNTYYGVSPQGWVTREMDYFQLSLSKSMLKNNSLSITVRYVPSIHFTRMRYTEITDCSVYYSRNVQDILESNRNAVSFNLSYRLAGGKSVRKYNRVMSEEN